MQISKTFLTGGVALCLVAVSARAADTASDAQLREALRQKIAEMSPPGAAPATPTAPAEPVAPAPVAPAPVAPPPAVEPVMTAPTAVVVSAPEPVAVDMAAPTLEDDAQTARMREALRARLAEENAGAAAVAPAVVTQGSDVAPAVSTAPVASTKGSKSKDASVTAAPAPVPMVAPPLPISASKEERLAHLLQQYKADQISPEEYHQQRAKILAE